ncbi:MAG: ELWxxDGT repeat protein [Gammaproteobacteria bacterium]
MALEAGTHLVKDILKGNSSSNIFRLTAVGGALYFSASDGVSGSELWKSDGTETGTYRVKDIVAGSGSSGPNDLQGINGILYFTAADSTNKRSLWKSDGTEAGTVPANPQSPYQDIAELMNTNGSMIFSAIDSVHGRELWMSDEAFIRAEMTNIAPDVTHSNPEMMININDLLYFVADDGLWANFGGSSGAYLVKDIRPEDVVSFNGLLYFKSKGGLWKSDGTTAGTVLVKAVTPVDDSDSWWLTTVNGMLYFSASNSHFFKELWKSDGTEAGTVKVKNIAAGPWWKRQSDYRGSFTNLNGTVYFSANDGTSGEELWKSDGTESGTILVKDIRAGSADSDPLYFTEMNGVLYFSASDGLNDRQLWKSDGTASGTMPLTFGVSPDGPLVKLNNTLYFQATNNQYGKELWKSDGTVAGTELVKDIYPGGSDSNPGQLTTLNGMLFFTADDGVQGAEFWKSDGTAAGTNIVNDIFPGIHSSEINNLVAGKDELFFVANDNEHGFELWQTDGTPAGTQLVSDLVSGNIGSDPMHLTAVDNTVFFSTNDGVAGRELWKYDAAPTTPPEAELALQVAINGQSSIKFGPTVAIGSTLAWEYTVINAGDIPLNNVEVRERRKLPTLGDWTVVCRINRIPVGETASCLVTKTATAGMYKSLVSVRANTSLETLAKAFYFGIDEDAELAATVTANNQPVAKPGPVLTVGETVTWVYRLTNTGTSILNDIEVRGRRKLPDLGSWETLCTIQQIPVGESARCSSTSTTIDGTYKSLIVARNASVEVLIDAFYQGLR